MLRILHPTVVDLDRMILKGLTQCLLQMTLIDYQGAIFDLENYLTFPQKGRPLYGQQRLSFPLELNFSGDFVLLHSCANNIEELALAVKLNLEFAK